MKFRTGFVSNSSSSSFVMIVDKDDHDKALENCSEYVKAVIATLEKTRIFKGNIIVIFMITLEPECDETFSNCCPSYDGEIPIGSDGEEMNPETAYEEYKKELKKITQNIIVVHSD